jgi:probable O-glycosylation ligase (exosortase A-associated)
MSIAFAVAYIIVEYMRPQSMYAGLAGLPLGEIAIIGFILCIILEGRPRFNYNFQNILISLYLFWFYISYLFAFISDPAWMALINFSKWVVIYFLLINTINDRKRLYLFTIIFLLLNFKYTQFATRVWVANGFYSDPQGINSGWGIASGFFQNQNDFGVAINSVLGMSYYMILFDSNKILGFFKWKWFHLLCSVSMVVAIVASSSRGAMLGLAAVALAVWFKSQRKFIAIPVLIVVAAGVVSLIPEDNWMRFQRMGSEEDLTGQSRIDLWRAGMRMAEEYPLTGVGPNNFIYVNSQIYQSGTTLMQHNVFVQAVSELGYPGLLLFIGMIIYCFRNQRRARKLLREKGIDDPFLYGLSHGLDICLVGFAVNGFFITVLYYPFFWMLLILSTSLFDVVKHLEQQSEQPVPVAGISERPWLQTVEASRYVKS